MRSIFSRLLLSFLLTILLSALISVGIMYSMSRRSVESFRHDLTRQLQANIARSVVLMGRSAWALLQSQGREALSEYAAEVDKAMHTQLFLVVGESVLPADARPQTIQRILEKLALHSGETYIEATARELLVASEMQSPNGQPYVIVGIHHLKPPPAMTGGGPPPPEGMRPPLPPPDRRGALLRFLTWPNLQTIVLLLLAGVVCFKLARSFSAPLDRLRRASRQIAAGDLTARVGRSLGKPGNELGDLGRDFDVMAERLERLVKAQKQLFLDISHELRSPLARLNLAVELIRKQVSPEHSAAVARIAKESDRLNDLIGQLLTLARLESRRSHLAAEPVDLAELLEDIAADIRFEMSGMNRSIRVCCAPGLLLIGNRELLRQAVENVIRNGMTYTRAGSCVDVEARVSSDATRKGEEMILRVRDHGPGVPEDQHTRIFEPFHRVAEARDRNSGGTGIGLAIAHESVRLHGGTITVENVPQGQGLIVEIRLPLASAA